MSNVFPTIPEFINTPEEMASALRAVKLSLELLAGLRQGESYGAPMVYVQPTEPNPAKKILYKTGDFWIDNSVSPPILKFWTGTAWQAVA